MPHSNSIAFIAMLLTTQLFQACVAQSGESGHMIKTGADRTEQYIPLLKGKSVGLVANHTTVIGNTHLADTLLQSGIRLTRIFAPEHGFRGDADAGAAIGDGTDPGTGIPVISLYGSKKKPDAGDLAGIDIMVYDIQDVGVRFYTYISTLHYVMEACAENEVPLLMLDRPNPNGHYVDGPVLDTAYRSFIGMHPIPVVYGMTIGELALMVNGEKWLGQGRVCDLRIISCENYDHNTVYELPIDPSPNLNSMEAVYLYPSMCFFEGTIMSLGRGTPFPFRVAGHPDYPVKTFSFVPTPNRGNMDPKLKGTECYGFDLRSITAAQARQIRSLNLQWLIGVYTTMGRGESFFTGSFNRLAGTGELKKQILSGWSAEQISKSWQPGLQAFQKIRKKYLLYPDFER